MQMDTMDRAIALYNDAITWINCLTKLDADFLVNCFVIEYSTDHGHFFFPVNSLSFCFCQWHEALFYLTSSHISVQFTSLHSPSNFFVHCYRRWSHALLCLLLSNNILWKFSLIRKFEYKFETCIINTWTKIEDFDRKFEFTIAKMTIKFVNETVTRPYVSIDVDPNDDRCWRSNDWFPHFKFYLIYTSIYIRSHYRYWVFWVK